MKRCCKCGIEKVCVEKKFFKPEGLNTIWDEITQYFCFNCQSSD